MNQLYLLDTSICVFFLRKNLQIAEQLMRVGLNSCRISEITVAELLYGAYCSKQPEKNLSLIKSFCNQFTIVSLSGSLEDFAQQKFFLRKKGIIIEDMDLLIGATAVHNDFILVTDNLKHFERLEGLKIENWIRR
ncbi:MAG: type II toxin-antitoxin system VapC family toxin [Muribaculaceae bacterium]|nr:type II toxin-antitoxin system VapC family toxin [Muribaculaceae bacterium]MDE6754736.1 type II toxin-antitoxin system VapC family toxin [Muribaculaceae bacterium]